MKESSKSGHDSRCMKIKDETDKVEKRLRN
jgi:hypothetical protein